MSYEVIINIVVLQSDAHQANVLRFSINKKIAKIAKSSSEMLIVW